MSGCRAPNGTAVVVESSHWEGGFRIGLLCFTTAESVLKAHLLPRGNLESFQRPFSDVLPPSVSVNPSFAWDARRQ